MNPESNQSWQKIKAEHPGIGVINLTPQQQQQIAEVQATGIDVAAQPPKAQPLVDIVQQTPYDLSPAPVPPEIVRQIGEISSRIPYDQHRDLSGHF